MTQKDRIRANQRKLPQDLNRGEVGLSRRTKTCVVGLLTRREEEEQRARNRRGARQGQALAKDRQHGQAFCWGLCRASARSHISSPGENTREGKGELTAFGGMCTS